MISSYERLFGKAPRWVVQAPGRVNLIGEYTDYNGGFVLPMAIDRCTQIAAAPNGSRTITLRSTHFDERLEMDLSRPITPGSRGDWSNYPKGVISGFLDAGHAVRGFDALIHSTVPLGCGLSSSASLEVAVATLLEAMSGVQLDPVLKAELCQKAEHVFANVPCGIMDQFTSTLARENHLLLLDCQRLEPAWIELLDPAICVLIVQTNVRHQLASGEYAVRRQQCEAAARAMDVALLRDATYEQLERSQGAMDNVIYRRARHVLTENIRTRHASRAIRELNWLEAGQHMYASHYSLRDDFEVSCTELDTVVEAARHIGPEGGVYGCRMTGGGFGGCAVALIETRKRESICNAIVCEYREATGIEPTIFTSRPAAGARLIYESNDSRIESV